MKKIIFSILTIFLSGVAVGNTTQTPSNSQTLLGDNYFGNAIFISGSQLPWVNKKVVQIDPYTGKPVLNIPLLHVPVSANLSLDLNIFNYYRIQFTQEKSWSSYNELGIDDKIYPALSDAYCGRNDPLFLDPQGQGHVFYPSTTSQNAFYSPDGWEAQLSIAGSFNPDGHCQLTTYSGTIYDPSGVQYIISPGYGGLSPVTEITTAASQGAAWIKYNYNGQNLSSITTSSGYSVQFQDVTISMTFGSAPFVGRITTSDGKSWSFQYATKDDQGNDLFFTPVLTEIDLADGTKWSLHNTGVIYPNPRQRFEGIFEGITYPNGASQSFSYSFTSNFEQAPYVVSSEQDVNLPINYSIAYSYGGDTNPTVTSVTTPTLKKVYTIVNDHPNNQPAWDAGLPSDEKVYDSAGQTLYQDIGLNWQPRQFSNDEGGAQPELTQKTTTQDGASYVVQNTQFDSYGYVNNTVESSPAGKVQITHTYYEDPSKWIFEPQTTKVLDANGNLENEIDNAYNSLGELVSNITNGVTTTYTYDNQGNIATKTDALDNKTAYGNYLAAQPQTITDALGNISHAVINNNGTVASKTDALGNTTQYQYDMMGRLIKITPPIGTPTTIQWNTPQLGDEIVTRGGYSKTIYNNGFGQPLETVEQDANSKQSRLTYARYDAMGNKTFQSFAYSQTPTYLNGMNYVYDALNRLTLKNYTMGTEFNPTTYSYGPGNVVAVTDPLGNKTVYGYRSFGDPDDKQLISIQAANGVTTTINRNVLGQVTSVQQGNLTRSYTYNSNNYLASEANPETGTTTYGRDLLGNMTSKQIGSGGVVQYAYDADNHLSKITPPDEPSPIIFTYDADGRLSSVTNFTAAWNYGYDANGNETSAQATVGDNNYAFAYQYDGLDHLASTTYPNTLTYSYAPDAFGEPTQLGNAVTNIQYYPNGEVQSYKNSDGNTVSYGLNDRMMPNQVSVTPANINLQYTYDGDNNLTALNANLSGTTYQESFKYDPINELIAANGGPWGNASMGYDGNGNLTQMNVGQNQYGYQYDSTNKLSAVTGTAPQTFSYDAQGNTTTDNGYTLNYNSQNQLIGLDNATTGDTNTYQYDGNGNRIILNHNNDATAYEFYQGSTLAYTSVSDTPTSSSIYLSLAGHIVAQHNLYHNEPMDVFYYNDLLGSPIAQTDVSSGLGFNLPSQYTPYGKEIANDPYNTTVHVGYTGKLNDSNTGLSYYGARYYDPTLGRFLSIDPAGVDPQNPFSFNRYAYANNNPYRYIDPTGMFSWSGLFNQLAPLVSLPINFNFGNPGGLDGNDEGWQQQLSDGALNFAMMAATMDTGYGEAELATGLTQDANYVADEVAGEGSSSVQSGTKLYRVFGGDAQGLGRSWTDVNPGNIPDFRNMAGLPTSTIVDGANNSGQFMAEGFLKDTTGVIYRRALPLNGNTGGLGEYVVPDPERQIELINVSGVNPEF